MGVTLEQRSRNHRMHPLSIAKHIVIPEPKHSIPFCLNEARSMSIGLFAILPTVALDHQLCPMAGEVDNVISKRQLPTEPGVGKAFTQHSPHGALS